MIMLNQNIYLKYLFLFVCICLCVYENIYGCLWEPEEAFRNPRAISGCEPPDTGSGK